MGILRLALPVLLSFLLVSSVSAAAFNWWDAAAGAEAGAATGALVGSVIPGLGTLAGAGVGALAGFIGASVVQLFANAPTTTSDPASWNTYAKDVYSSIVSQSQLIADNMINQVNLLQQARLAFIVTAQKWEQVNYNVNISPSTPYEFYRLLKDTGFLGYVSELVGGTQTLWITEQGLINSVDQQLSPYGLRISYDVNPNQTVVVTPPPGTTLVAVVAGQVVFQGPNVPSYQGSTTICAYSDDGQVVNVTSLTWGDATTLRTGLYVIRQYGYNALHINPNQGMVLLFVYNNGAYTPVNWGFNVPSMVYLYQGNNVNSNGTLPRLSGPLPFIAEQVAISMLGAAQTEYSILKSFGYHTAVQIPANMTLPTINLNIGNFSNFTTSLQAYNLYLAIYTRELLQIQETLQALSQEGKLAGLQELSFNASNPLETYGRYGGFVTNGTIVLPDGQTMKGLYLVQPYGGPLSLSSSGGTVGGGGAVAYQLIPVGNGTYGLGVMYVLPPNTTIMGDVKNPGTLAPVAQGQKADYYNVSTPQVPVATTQPSAFGSLSKFFVDHPVALLLTIAFVLVVVVVLVRSLAK
jgi:hypothetical protein